MTGGRPSAWTQPTSTALAGPADSSLPSSPRRAAPTGRPSRITQGDLCRSVDRAGELRRWKFALKLRKVQDRRQAMRIVPPSQHPEVTRRFEQGRVYSLQGFEAVVSRPKGD
jgi:hypothetical protein